LRSQRRAHHRRPLPRRALPAPHCGVSHAAACAAAARLGAPLAPPLLADPAQALLHALSDAWLRTPQGKPGTLPRHACAVLRAASVLRLEGATPRRLRRRAAALSGAAG
jgi:hypothetical protein